MYTYANGVLNLTLDSIQNSRTLDERPEVEHVRDIFWLSFLKYFVIPKVTMSGMLKVFRGDLLHFILKGGLGAVDSASAAFTIWLTEINQGSDEPLRLEELPVFQRFYQELEAFVDPVVDEILLQGAHVLELS